MTTKTLRSSAVLMAVGLAAVTACFGSGSDGSSGSPGDTTGGNTGGASGGSEGGTGGGPSVGGDAGSAGGHKVVPITATDTGYVDGTNDFGILGAWYGYGDNWGPSGGPPGKCQAASHSDTECSSITFPPASAGGADGGGAGFPQTTPGEFCLKGKAGRVIGTPPDYSNIFGIGIGFDFNNQGGVKKPYSASTHGIIGFHFKIAGVPAAPGAVRVEFAMPATDATGDAYSKTISSDGVYTVLFTDLKPSFALPAGTSEPPFDPSAIESIQFHVPTVTAAAIDAVNVCVSEFAVVTQ